MKAIHPFAQFYFAREAIDMLVFRISTLPPSEEVAHLLLTAEACRADANSWTSVPPDEEVSQRLMRNILKLHVEVAKLERADAAGK